MDAAKAITDEALRERLLLDDHGFAEMLVAFAAALGRRTCDDHLLARAYGYPWSRPGHPYLLLPDGTTTAFAAGRTAGRLPLLAFGANGSPAALRTKLAHFADPEDRTVPVVTGRLPGFDVGPSAAPTAYGSMAGALFASPGTTVSAAMLWVTAAQFQQLTWSELGLRPGRLRDARFLADEGPDAEDPIAYVHRVGVLPDPDDGRPLALAAIPADGRTARAVSQEQALAIVAAELLDREAAGPDDLVHAIYDDWGRLAPRAVERLWPRGIRLDDDAWELVVRPA